MAQPQIAHMVDGKDDAPITIIMANGARMPMDGPFMNRMASRIRDAGLRLFRFEFPFQVEERKSGERKPVNQTSILIAAYKMAARKAANGNPLIVGGRSLGATVATHTCESLRREDLPVVGALCLGYPFHQLDDPKRDRLKYLQEVTVPTLVLQGTEDRMAIRKDVEKYKLPSNVTLEWLDGVNHLLAEPESRGDSYNEKWDIAVERCIGFAKSFIE